jgi:hypothetical protein
VAPEHPPAEVGLTISYNGQQFLSLQQKFTYHVASTVAKVVPALGPSSGGAVVTVFGSNFLNTSTLCCQFGDKLVSATFLNASALTCLTPRSEVQRSVVPLEVSNNGQDFSSRSAVQYKYVPAVAVSSVQPPRGATTGGTVMNIRVDAFSSVEAVSYCRIGDVTVPATQLDDSTFSCVAPSVRAAGVAAVVLLNAERIPIGSTSFEYYVNPRFAAVVPAAVSDAGGAFLVRGENFQNLVRMQCRLDGAVSDAVFVSSTMLRCFAAPHIPTTADLEVSINGVDFVSTSLTITYVERATVHRISPAVISTRGGANVLYFGSNFQSSDSVACQFDDIAVRATVSSNSVLSCVAPAHATGTSVVSIATNGVADSSANAAMQITYVEEPRQLRCPC